MGKINTTVDAFTILLSIFYKSNEEDDKWQDLANFLKQSAFSRFPDEDNLEDLFIGLVTKIHPKAIRKGGKYHRWQVKLSAKYNPIEGEWTQPMVSRPMDNMMSIKDYSSGSKLNFKRTGLAGGKLHTYSHTGILMRLDDVEYVVEVIKPKDSHTTIGLTSFSNKDNEQNIQVNNSYLCKRGVDLHDIAYRMALVLGCEIACDALRFNCDVVATWLITGQTQWNLMSCMCQTGLWIFEHLPLPMKERKTVGVGLNSKDLDDAEFKGGATQREIRESWHTY